MADALLSPAVGGSLWAASAGVAVYSSRRIRLEKDESKTALMGVMGAFVFAAQMINFTIPLTGSSGHLGGGLLLAAMLGPYGAFIAIASILAVQALFFADGGLLALGANAFNLGFFPCFIAYPLIFRPIVGTVPTRSRIIAGSMLAGVAGLQLGAFAVVLETVTSGVSKLPFGSFVLLMQPIHLAIGIVEGVVTGLVLSFVWQARPGVLYGLLAGSEARVSMRRLVVSLGLCAALTGGVLSWFASENPDGLEWSIAKVTGEGEPGGDGGIHSSLAAVQDKTAILPDYGFGKSAAAGDADGAGGGAAKPDLGKSVSGLVGGFVTLALVALVGLVVSRRRATGAR